MQMNITYESQLIIKLSVVNKSQFELPLKFIKTIAIYKMSSKMK